jgi:hypothetical protein
MLKLAVIGVGLADWSMTWTVKFEVPKAPVGVPEMTPDVLMLRPAGSDPPAIEKVRVPLPPEAPIVAPAYVAPVVPAANAPGGVVKLIGGFSVTATVCVLVGSATLAIVITELAAALTTGVVYSEEGELPLTVLALIVPPAPVTTKDAPDALPSPVMEAPIVDVCAPSPIRLIEFAEFRVIAIGVSGIVAVADLVGSATLVAVTTAVAVLTGLGAVNNPCELIEPAEAVHVTPEPLMSLPTVSLNCRVAPPIIAAGAVGLIVTVIGFNAIVTAADLVGSLTLVAVTVAVAVVTGLAET